MASDELDEKDFIKKENPNFLWTFLILFILVTILFWGLGKWQEELARERQLESPFYQVTNREYSIFLSQNPAYRVENNRLYFHDGSLIPKYADDYVSVPSELIFRYHVWDRLLGENSLASRPISAEEFSRFLKENQAWLPKYWGDASTEYHDLVSNVDHLEGNLADQLPREVRLAFQGWRNETFEIEKIKEVLPTKEELKVFLEAHPHYGRSYWSNLLPYYLKNFDKDQPLEESDLSSFLKMAIFNFQKS